MRVPVTQGGQAGRGQARGLGLSCLGSSRSRPRRGLRRGLGCLSSCQVEASQGRLAALLEHVRGASVLSPVLGQRNGVLSARAGVLRWQVQQLLAAC